MAQDKTKKTLSTKVSLELKQRLTQEAGAKGETLSEYTAKILATDWTEQKKKHEKEIEKLKEELKEKDKLVNRLAQSLEREQQLLSQQQQLQLQTHKQLDELQRSQQLLIESTEQKKKWWQIWRK